MILYWHTVYARSEAALPLLYKGRTQIVASLASSRSQIVASVNFDSSMWQPKKLLLAASYMYVAMLLVLHKFMQDFWWQTKAYFSTVSPVCGLHQRIRKCWSRYLNCVNLIVRIWSWALRYASPLDYLDVETLRVLYLSKNGKTSQNERKSYYENSSESDSEMSLKKKMPLKKKLHH